MSNFFCSFHTPRSAIGEFEESRNTFALAERKAYKKRNQTLEPGDKQRSLQASRFTAQQSFVNKNCGHRHYPGRKFQVNERRICATNRHTYVHTNKSRRRIIYSRIW